MLFFIVGGDGVADGCMSDGVRFLYFKTSLTSQAANAFITIYLTYLAGVGVGVTSQSDVPRE